MRRLGFLDSIFCALFGKPPTSNMIQIQVTSFRIHLIFHRTANCQLSEKCRRNPSPEKRLLQARVHHERQEQYQPSIAQEGYRGPQVRPDAESGGVRPQVTCPLRLWPQKARPNSPNGHAGEENGKEKRGGELVDSAWVIWVGLHGE
jgi:hypothetical protein